MSVKKTFEKIAEQFKDDITCLEINAQQFDQLSKQYNVRKVPTFVYIKDGQEQGRSMGYQSYSEFIAKIKQYLAVAQK